MKLFRWAETFPDSFHHSWKTGCGDAFKTINELPVPEALNKMTPTLSKPAIADRISLISVSSTMKVMADADKLRREGVDVVDFSAGEPDFITPANIRNAGIAAINAGFTKYPPAGGTAEIKQAIVDRHK